MSNRVVHFEIPSEDPKKAMDFFGKVFGWKFKQFGDMEYWTVFTGDGKSEGIDGGLMKRNDPRQPITNSIEVDDIDKMAEAVKNAGGEIVVPKMAIPTVGWLVYFKDLDGNIHGLYQHAPDAN
ncbi:MAG TPA: VOC family protein [Ignavibacteria bacterium]|nr:VOC family protein [Ignavibacteria bacterium]